MNLKVNLDSIILYVGDVEKLKAFYVDTFGLRVIEEIANEWVLLDAGNSNIGLHKAGSQFWNESKGAFRANSNAKMVFEIEDDIAWVREQLIAQNVSMREVKTFEGYNFWLCDGEDPEGNVFQLKQQK